MKILLKEGIYKSDKQSQYLKKKKKPEALLKKIIKKIKKNVRHFILIQKRVLFHTFKTYNYFLLFNNW